MEVQYNTSVYTVEYKKAKSQERDTLEKFAFQIHSKAAQVGSQNSMLPKIKILKNSAQDNLLAHNKYT